jgi:hypothetical protein
MPETQLKATYRSPETSRTFQHDLPPLSGGDDDLDVKQKTAYLSELRASIGNMQNDVNVFLTQKMEDEKLAQSRSTSAGKTKEEKEEENYGEEDPEDGS